MLYFKHYDADSGVYLQTLDGEGQGNITEAEYNQILDALRSRPVAPDEYGYRLREDLTWELFELPAAIPPSDDGEISTEEAMEILLGGAR